MTSIWRSWCDFSSAGSVRICSKYISIVWDTDLTVRCILWPDAGKEVLSSCFYDEVLLVMLDWITSRSSLILVRYLMHIRRQSFCPRQDLTCPPYLRFTTLFDDWLSPDRQHVLQGVASNCQFPYCHGVGSYKQNTYFRNFHTLNILVLWLILTEQESFRFIFGRFIVKVQGIFVTFFLSVSIECRDSFSDI
jgi:hypothetical protein